jgi:hypothetical protein
MNKLAIESYLRNLLGQVIGAIIIVTQMSGVASPLDFSVAEWLLVANALWASVIPTALRWLNSKDPAFGRVAEAAAAEVGKQLLIRYPVRHSAATSAKKTAAKK